MLWLVQLLEDGLGDEHVEVERWLQRRAEALDEGHGAGEWAGHPEPPRGPALAGEAPGRRGPEPRRGAGHPWPDESAPAWGATRALHDGHNIRDIGGSILYTGKPEVSLGLQMVSRTLTIRPQLPDPLETTFPIVQIFVRYFWL